MQTSTLDARKGNFNFVKVPWREGIGNPQKIEVKFFRKPAKKERGNVLLFL
jgi:hypothetical protein